MDLIFAFIASFLWGTTYSVTQHFLSGWPPLLLGTLRALPAGLLLLALRPQIPRKRVLFKLSIIGIINIGAFFVCIFIMALNLPSAISSVGMMSVPVFAMAIQWGVMKQTPSRVQILSGIGLVVIAVSLFNPGSIQLSPLGLMAMVVAVICIIIGSVLTKTLNKQVHWWSVVTWQLISGGVVLLALCCVDMYIHPHQYIEVLTSFSIENTIGLGWIILVNTALAYSLYVWALQHLSIVEFTFSGVANPMAGVMGGFILSGESYTGSQYLLMFAMVAMSLLPNILKSIKTKNKQSSDSIEIKIK
ncbi:DMT family transporter [Vibrio viridaestus]|uniref:EamA family transporter n=1 Tax=Vibrio viridaestus TaxID=2487322 RepID=A0A3N9TIE1_9VIBR|nr:EamA family transporter [Vibrio viridaestus]RQW63979.1 EamA family transporter [Vibrio viridaestus]